MTTDTANNQPDGAASPANEPIGAHGTDGAAIADCVAIPLLEFGRAWIMADSTSARAGSLGFEPPFGFWVNGRAGVIGSADASVAASAIGFMAPDMVRHFWDNRPDRVSAPNAALAYAEAAATWGRQVLADWSTTDLDRLSALCDQVAAAANPTIGVIFAGWRSLTGPTDPAGRATVALNVIREMRGAAHLTAVNAVGLGPHGAIIATDDPIRGGEAGAQRFGWSEPHPPVDTKRRAEAERLTSAICAPAFEAIGPAAGQEMVDLVLAARAAVDH